ncbi:MAG TPA: phasin family protein [Methyloceanibacter sp.]|nr:phasin family protein [Methyloceanibacter sp.]
MMSETAIPQTPQEAAEKVTESLSTAAKEFETLKLDTTVPESVRMLAEKTVNQTREAYERGKESLEDSIDALERSFDAANQGATAFNRKLIDIAQRNLNSGFDLAKNMATAKNLAEIVELQSAFIRSQFEVFASQAGEIRALTTKIAADTSEPIKDQVSRSMENVRKAS